MMLDFVVRLDQTILDRVFQPVVDFVGSRRPVSQITLARICFGAWVIYTIWMAWNRIRAFQFDIFWIIPMILLVIGTIDMSHNCQEKIKRRHSAQGNLNRVAAQRIRVFLFWIIVGLMPLPTSPFMTWELFAVGYLFFPFCGWFFASCEGPRPKAQRRVVENLT